MNLDDDRPVCDFCDLMIEEDESLEPIFVGGPEKPRPHFLKQIGHRGGMGERRYKAKYDAIRRALYDCPDVMLNESDTVHEVEALGGDTQFATEDELTAVPNPTDFTTKRTEKIGVNIKIEPKDVDYSPDAEVCPNCAEMFRSMGD